MKKLYMQPTVDVVEIELQGMLAASLPLDDTNTVTDEDDVLAPPFTPDFFSFAK